MIKCSVDIQHYQIIMPGQEWNATHIQKGIE